MKKKINLLISHEDQAYLYARIKLFRFIILVFSIFSAVFLFVLLVFLYVYNKSYENLIKRKESILENFNSHITTEKKIQLLVKYLYEIQRLREYDVNFLPYYKILTDSMNQSTESAQLSSISVDNKRNVTMKLNFVSYDSMLSFISFLQSDIFLNKFSSLNIESFSINEKKSLNYSLIITGVFNPISKQNTYEGI